MKPKQNKETQRLNKKTNMQRALNYELKLEKFNFHMYAEVKEIKSSREIQYLHYT